MQFSFLSSIYRVSEVAAHLRELIEADDILSDVWVQGEISNATRHASGHFYFSLKDDRASIRCVMWRREAARLPRLPREGEAVYAHGHFSVYDARGEVQLYADELELLGAGALWQEFERLKGRLEAEGLFDAARKRPLPRFPQHIGIVTSRDGAVLHDILHILTRRYPLPRVYLAPCAVQGLDAPPQIVAALECVQRVPDLDVIILARGGGSIEDLWAFNDERVARAIGKARVPVVCGVGHETDFTIADFCADVRAPTPTGAAQFCTPDQNELRANLMLCERRLAHAVQGALGDSRRRLVADTNALLRTSPRARVANRRQEVDDLAHQARDVVLRQLNLERAQLHGAIRHLEALNPRATLERGYAIVRRQGEVVTSISDVAPREIVDIRVRDGEFQARVE